MEELIGLTAVVLIFGVPFFAIWTRFQIDRERIRQEKADKANAALLEEIQRVRETSTQYALSLEDALQRVERRLDQFEQRLNNVEQQQLHSRL